MPGREKSRESENDPNEKAGGSDRKRKRESDKKENQDEPSKKKNKGFEQFRRLQQHNAEIKGFPSQSKPEIASEQPKPHEPLGDTTNIPKTDSQEKPKSGLETKEVKENIDPIKMGYERKILQERGPSVDLSFDLLRNRREIPKPPPRLDTNPNKSQD